MILTVHNSGPEMFGIPTANLALCVAVGAIAISIVSACTAVASYRRGGFRVGASVRSGTSLDHDVIAGPGVAQLLIVEVVNGGQAPVEIRDIEWRQRKRFRLRYGTRLPLFNHEGPVCPTVISGNSELSFITHFQVVGSNLGSRTHKTKVRAEVRLRGGQIVKSKPFTIQPKDWAVTTR